jgi:tail collar domain
MFGLINRGSLPEVTLNEFENLIARLKRLWLTEHNSDGTHTSANTVPVGAVMLWPISTAPAGWLVCNGAAVSRTTYVDLFNVVGITFGAGDGSTTFNIPGTSQVAFQSDPVSYYIIFAGA